MNLLTHNQTLTSILGYHLFVGDRRRPLDSLPDPIGERGEVRLKSKFLSIINQSQVTI